MSDVLTMSDVLALAALIDGHRGTASVRWSTDDGATIAEGTLRGFKAAEGHDGVMRHGQDVRDAWVRITTRGGLETWLSVRDVIALYSQGAFAFDH